MTPLEAATGAIVNETGASLATTRARAALAGLEAAGYAVVPKGGQCMIVLLGTNRQTGQVAEVGLYESIDAARYHAHKNSGHVLYSVWTPGLNDTIKAASITGLSLPPEVVR